MRTLVITILTGTGTTFNTAKLSGCRQSSAGKYAYSSRIKWLHIDDKTLLKSAILNQFGKNLQ